MIKFNTSFNLARILEPLSQEEILATPSFRTMSLEQIIKHHDCPLHLKKVLNSMKWSGRQSVIQVRVQDFREENMFALGGAWHCDVDAQLANGDMLVANSLHEFDLQLVSFGGVAGTEFLLWPLLLDIPHDSRDAYEHSDFAKLIDSHLAKQPMVQKILYQDGALISYSSFDIHRLSPEIRIGRARLVIVAFECDQKLPEDAGRVGPALII